MIQNCKCSNVSKRDPPWPRGLKFFLFLEIFLEIFSDLCNEIPRNLPRTARRYLKILFVKFKKLYSTLFHFLFAARIVSCLVAARLRRHSVEIGDGRGFAGGRRGACGGRGPSQAVSSVLSICIVSSMSLHWTTILPMHRVTETYTHIYVYTYVHKHVLVCAASPGGCTDESMRTTGGNYLPIWWQGCLLWLRGTWYGANDTTRIFSAATKSHQSLPWGTEISSFVWFLDYYDCAGRD